MIKVCYTWGNAGIKWPQANWTWDECQLVAECIRWGDASVLWKDANWLWSQCSGSVIPPKPPITASIVLQPTGVDATTLIPEWLIEPWNPYRAGERKDNRKKWIKLICKVKGETFEEEKEIENYDISINDIKMVVHEVSGIELNIK